MSSIMAYGEDKYRAVMSLVGNGISDGAIAAKTGVAAGTVRRWRLAKKPPDLVRRRQVAEAWSVPVDPIYCYLLGAYLGDGTVTLYRRSAWCLRIFNDRRYRSISQEILAAMRTTFPGGHVRLQPSSTSEADVLSVRHPAVPRAFPQHGPGRKHDRAIVLADWQLERTRADPGALIRGLIHSDVAGPSTGSGPSCRAGEQPSTPTSVISSRTCPRTCATSLRNTADS